MIALAAGGIVALYTLLTLGKKAIPYLGIYTLSAAAVSYITWPYLWYFGLPGLVESLLKFSDFSWKNEVLFEGQLLAYNAVPRWYLPKLMLLQFTEPVLLLTAAGLVISLIWLIQKKLDWKKMSLLYAWFALPMIYTIANHTTTYNNFRQYLFITPPLFILAGIALYAGLSKLKGKFWPYLAALIILFPAVQSIIQLHPYEYIYYNQLTGGVSGAYRQYELDYWLTAMKAMAKYVDEHVPPGSSIMVWGNSDFMKTFTKNRYEFLNMGKIPEEDYVKYDYAVIPTSDFRDLRILPNEEIIYQIERNDGVLMVLKKTNSETP